MRPVCADGPSWRTTAAVKDGVRGSVTSYVPTVTQEVDLAAASIDLLVLVLGEAMRLGYHDERHGHPRRTANQIGHALGLARWNGLQQLQLCHAYKAGGEHLAVERIQATRR